jgi:hypothetical protein
MGRHKQAGGRPRVEAKVEGGAEAIAHPADRSDPTDPSDGLPLPGATPDTPPAPMIFIFVILILAVVVFFAVRSG